MKKFALLFVVGLSIILMGCGRVSEPEKPLADILKEKGEPSFKKDDGVYPVLKLKENGENKDFQLKSQVVKYLDAERKKFEIYLSNSKLLSCNMLNPKLAEEEKVLIVKVEGNEKVSVSDYPKDGVKVGVEIRNSEGSVNLGDQAVKIQVSDVNEQIIRGKIAIEAKGESYSGDFFGATCL